MEVIIKLDNKNTEIKKERPYNFIATVYLDSIWNEIKEHNRIFLVVYLTIPILRNEKEAQMDISLQNYFNTLDVLEEQERHFVTIKGFVEGVILDAAKIESECVAWSYDILE